MQLDPMAYTRRNEGGVKNRAYWDKIGMCWTVGVGCTGPDIGPNTVWSDQQAEDEFAKRYQAAVAQAAADLGPGPWAVLDEVRRAVLADMAYQLGRAGLAGFAHMLTAIRANCWRLAYGECLDSAYAREVPARAARNAEMLLTGQWPTEPW